MGILSSVAYTCHCVLPSFLKTDFCHQIIYRLQHSNLAQSKRTCRCGQPTWHHYKKACTVLTSFSHTFCKPSEWNILTFIGHQNKGWLANGNSNHQENIEPRPNTAFSPLKMVTDMQVVLFPERKQKGVSQWLMCNSHPWLGSGCVNTRDMPPETISSNTKREQQRCTAWSTGYNCQLA